MLVRVTVTKAVMFCHEGWLVRFSPIPKQCSEAHTTSSHLLCLRTGPLFFMRRGMTAAGLHVA
jgi:hypothetical protein